MNTFYIDGYRLECSENQNVSLIFNTPFFGNLSDIMSNGTLAIDFPKTPSNLRAIGFADDLIVKGDKVYKRLRAEYYRDNALIFSGFANILSITDKSIKMNFVWGNVDNFSQMQNFSLQDLQKFGEPTHYTLWDDFSVRDAQFNYAKDSLIKEGRPDYQLPMLSVNDIIDEIASQRGITINRGNRFSDLVIPLTTKYLDAYSNQDSALHITQAVSYGIRTSTSPFANFRISVLVPSVAQDPQHQYINDGLYDVSTANRIALKIDSGLRISVNKSKLKSEFGLCVFACDMEGKNGVALTEMLGTWRTTMSGKNQVKTLLFNIDTEIDVSNYSYIYLRLAEVKGATSVAIANCDLRLVNTDFDSQNEVGYSSLFPLYHNLPDISQAEFLQNIMYYKGLYAVSRRENHIEFVSLDDVLNNLNNSKDWSDRVILSDNHASEIKFAFDSMAQRNNIKYKSDEITKYDGSFACRNESLEREKDYINLVFSPIEGNELPLWTKDENDNWQFKADTNAYIARMTGTEIGGFQQITFDNQLGFYHILKQHYGLYCRMMLQPKIIKVSVRYEIKDIINFDMVIPVYIKQFGKYYAVIKFTTKGEKEAEAELIELSY